MLSYQNNSSYKAFIVSYNLTEQEIIELKNNHPVDLTNKISVIELNDQQIIDNIFNKSSSSNKSMISDVTIVIEYECCSYDNPSHPNGRYETDGRRCPGNSSCYSYLSTSGSSTGGSGSSTGSSSTPSSGGPNYTGGGGSSGTTSPVVDGVEASIDRVNSLIGPLNFKQKKCLKDNLGLLLGMEDFLYDNNSTEDKEFAKEAFDISCEFPNIKFERIVELNELLENDPWAIIQDCAQQNGLDIANYQQLYEHILPTQCSNRLNILGGDFQDQPLAEGNAAVANVDYYGVEITTNPDINKDGNPDTDTEVFQAYKENFSSLASGGKDDFEFSCNNPFGDNFGDVSWTFLPYFANDVSIWNSSNPLTAIFKIDASAEEIPFGDFISDDGAIMISKFASNYWIGSTIATEFSGTQPFSGNRQWGFIRNLNGNLELYARAVDVARVSNLVKNWIPGSDECKEDSYYNIGEATWSNLQEEIKQFIIDNGGQAQVVPKTAVRFDKEKIKELLESNESIDQIPCD